MTEFRDDFDRGELDRSVWFPHYLPAWSSADLTRASYRITDSCLRLFIPTEFGLWCAGDHPEPLRVSGIQSGSYSGPVGSGAGQQRFRDDQRVLEHQPHFEGWLPSSGRVTIRCSMELSARSMAAMWLSGFEQDPAESGEICIVEVFGRSVRRDGTAEIGVGVKKKHDPRLVDDFAAPRLAIDVSGFHRYAVQWNADLATFFVDDEPIHTSARPPTYPLQVMLAIFDFPAWSTGADDHLVPGFDIDSISGVSAS
jgi:Glycosyl hydrolases family 16